VVVYPFAALVIFAAVRILWGRNKERELVASACAVCGSGSRASSRSRPRFRGGSFWVGERGRLVATPLFIALVVVETTDVIFALDSIPAVFAVTPGSVFVYTSNVFAMLGLRSLYFLLAGVVDRFRFLRAGLAIILAFVGVKLLFSGVVEIPTWVSLAVIAAALSLAVTASVTTTASRCPEEWFPKAARADLACTILQSPDLKNASRSALTRSLCVEGRPCGAPGRFVSVEPLTSLDESMAEGRSVRSDRRHHG